MPRAAEGFAGFYPAEQLLHVRSTVARIIGFRRYRTRYRPFAIRRLLFDICLKHLQRCRKRWQISADVQDVDRGARVWQYARAVGNRIIEANGTNTAQSFGTDDIDCLSARAAFLALTTNAPLPSLSALHPAKPAGKWLKYVSSSNSTSSPSNGTKGHACTVATLILSRCEMQKAYLGMSFFSVAEAR